MIRLLVSPEEEVCCGLSKCQETAGQTPNGPQEGRRDPDPEAGSGSGPQLSVSAELQTLREPNVPPPQLALQRITYPALHI
ncbi:Mediator of RNA polymerase II transcription subunit 17 [Dissostichus eleginoides]|uniref:Mediator of RNA polymerase II transcription subunit 17 n=1 Tax=Dissostichus eleginoides TaxID=100907 RepID=A0AAD9BHY0_DISEL|nr:Mediator of RNA polymerase II transcription subunit 17 [Dissostichus eleginoides]